MTTFPVPRSILTVLLLPLLIFGCTSSVYLTTSLDEYTQTQDAKACTTNAGAYALPKGVLSFDITKIENGSKYRYQMSDVVTETSTDTNHLYCLDYRANAFAKDTIAVKRNEQQQLLLQSVHSNVEDQSGDVIVQAVEAGAVLTAQIASNGLARQFAAPTTGTVGEVMQFKFDPFDVDDLTLSNQQLIRRGYCVYIDPDGDSYVPRWMANQCTSRKKYTQVASKSDNDAFFDTSSYTAGRGRVGILYKPVLPHTLVILKRDDPNSPNSRWRVWRRQVLELPNRAPPFMIEVKRSLFTTRTTAITFKNGTLDNIIVDKESEMNAVSNVFVRVVEVIVQIPVKALLISTNKAKNREALIRTNQELIQTLNDLRKAQQDQQDTLAGLTPEQQAQAAAYGLRTSRGRLLAENFQECLNNLPADGSIQDPEQYCSEVVQ